MSDVNKSVDAARQSFANAAATYDAAAFLARETGRRMAERLDYVKLAPRRIADMGCATGDGIRDLQRRYPSALPLAIDLAAPMLHAARAATPLMKRWLRRGPQLLNADANALPLAAGCLGLIWSNLMLHWLDDPLPALRELQRTLEVGGLLMFAMLGPDTLKELRLACREDGCQDQAIPLRRFHDMHDIGDMLLAVGFADPVMDMEMITATYASPRDLLRDQRQLGVRNALFGRMPWRAWRQAFRTYERQRSEDRLPASFEIIYGHAWKPEARVVSDGRAIVHFKPKQ
ncbi:MAG: methyltransferase domain-containing protein [Proteobacteria bacterium]|nr:methyltransferase domain-containing protein [Pseudomonadota bacterium]